MLHAVETGDGRAFSVVAAFVLSGELGDEAIIRGEKAVAGSGRDPIQQFGIERAVGLALRRFAGDARVHVGDALDDAPRSVLRSVHANHRRHARPLRAAYGIFRVGRVIPHARADARIGEFQEHRRDAANAKRDRVLEHAP